jgi:acylphosphatase
MATIALVVTGRVQGVGFRAFVFRIATEMNLRGEVWNSRGGTVEVIAQHDDPEVLDRFREKLAMGPGRVDKVLGALADVATVYDEFVVSYRV